MKILLNNLDFHDTPVNSFLLDLLNGYLVISVSQFDENRQELFDIELKFSGVTELDLDMFPDISILEILNVNIQTENPKKTRVEFLLTYDYPSKHIKISFKFREVEIDFPEQYMPRTI